LTRIRSARKAEWEALCRRSMRDAVVRVLSREGAPGLTMEKVAAEAGVAKGTLYLYYKDKQALLEAVKEESFRPMREELTAILDGDDLPREKIRRFVSCHLGYFDEHRGFFKVLLWDRNLSGTYLSRRQGTFYRSTVQKIARILEEGVRDGAFRPVDGVKVAAMLIESDIVMIAQRLQEEPRAPLKEDAQMVLDVLMNGISARRNSLPRRP
jgi:AcrR family transcriptional regulator